MENLRQENSNNLNSLPIGIHNCEGKSDNFYYVCGKFEIPQNRRSITEKLKKIYKKCYNLEISNQDINWIPHIVCNTCYKMFNRWDSKFSQKLFKFTRSMIWKRPLNREECYICMTNIRGVNRKNKSKICYANLQTVEIPIMALETTVEEVEEMDTSDEP